MAALVLAVAVTALTQIDPWQDRQGEDRLAGPPSPRPSAPAVRPQQSEVAPPTVQRAVSVLVSSLGVSPASVAARWVHGPAGPAMRHGDTMLAMGLPADQQVYVVEVASAGPLTCTTCFGVVPAVGRVHAVIVLDSETAQSVASYVRDASEDLSDVGQEHQLTFAF